LKVIFSWHGCDEREKVGEAIQQFHIVALNFPTEELAKEALYYSGVSYYHFGDADPGQQKIIHLPELSAAPTILQKRFDTNCTLPMRLKKARENTSLTKINPSPLYRRDEAIKNHDEVVAAFPSHDLGAKALFQRHNPA